MVKQSTALRRWRPEFPGPVELTEEQLRLGLAWPARRRGFRGSASARSYSPATPITGGYSDVAAFVEIKDTALRYLESLQQERDAGAGAKPKPKKGRVAPSKAEPAVSDGRVMAGEGSVMGLDGVPQGSRGSVIRVMVRRRARSMQELWRTRE